MYQNTGAAEGRISALLTQAQRLLGTGRIPESLAAQREAADRARQLVAEYPDNQRLRQGLASVLYNLASLLVSTGDPAAAVPELDECLGLYESLAGTAAGDATLLCADVRARRGLALAMLGRAASAIVDADAAVRTYLESTEGDIDHPLRRDVARVLALNAAVLARRGDPGLAAASADGAMAYYQNEADQSARGLIPAQDSGYLRTAAAVSALLHLAAGELAEAVYPVLVVILNGLAPGPTRESVEAELARIDRLLARSQEVALPIPYPADQGRALAEALIPALQSTGTLWLPEGRGPGQPGEELPPTLEETLGRYATGPHDADLPAGLSASQPRDLVWTASMRWPGEWLARGSRLAELALEALPRAYPDGLRLALDAHALLACGHRRAIQTTGTAPDWYVPTWRRLLAQTTIACAAAGDDALTEDLAGLEAVIGDPAWRP